MKKFQYFTDYIHIPLVNAREVDVRSLINNPSYKEHLATMGQDGWEMVAVQPIIEATSSTSIWVDNKHNPPITTGFILFWKREIA